METAEYAQSDATALAALILSGEVTAQEVMAAAQDAIDQVEPSLNACVRRLEEPLDHANEGPFAGVPFAIKDLVTHAAGVPQQAGTRMTGGGIPLPHDTELMARFRRAGLATTAVTTCPEMGFSAVTEPIVTGATRNPWNVAHTPGGSSGGSAALVAAGALPVAHANDGGGSIRIPAAHCGLVGLKPSRGRVSVAPDYSDPLLGMGVEFALTRTVRDCAALLDAVHGSVNGDKFLLPQPTTTFLDASREPHPPLRIAMTTRRLHGPDAGPINSDVIAAVHAVATQLESLGHTVVEATPPVPPEFDHANLIAWCSFLADGVSGLAAALGIEPGPDVLEPATLLCHRHGMTLSALDIYDAERIVNATTRGIAAFQTDHDVLLMPTTARPAPPIGEFAGDKEYASAQAYYDTLFTSAPFTAVFNATGQPAISLPLSRTAEGLPIGVQLVGRYAAEETLLSLAGSLEEAVGWADHTPAVTPA